MDPPLSPRTGPSLEASSAEGGVSAASPAGHALWAIVLAGGEGVRLRPLVRRVHGDERPKQFATLVGSRSLLRHTLDRVRPAIPRERLVVIASRRHERYVAGEFAGAPAARLLLQPADRGTAAGVLYPVHWVRRQDPRAVIAVFPADHFIADEAAFMSHITGVAGWARRHPETIVLVGGRATGPETEYGWIEQGEPLGKIASGPIRGIARFREKPSPREARDLFERDRLWNTFVMVAGASALVEAGRLLLPDLSARLEFASSFAGKPEETRAIERAYAGATPADFSRSVLAACPTSLAVSEMPRVGWNDWGTPDRVLRSLEEAGLQPAWRRHPAAVAGATLSRVIASEAKQSTPSDLPPG